MKSLRPIFLLILSTCAIAKPPRKHHLTSDNTEFPYEEIAAAQSLSQITTEIKDKQQALAAGPTTEGQESYQKFTEIAQEKTGDLLEKFPDSPKVHTAAAMLSLQLGDNQGALDRAGRALRLAADRGDRMGMVDAYKARALAYVERGDLPRAHAEAEEARNLDPTDPAALAISKLTEGRGKKKKLSAPQAAPDTDTQDLIDQTRASVVNRPAGFSESLTRVRGADNAMKLGDYEEMERQATIAAQKAPNNPRAYMQRAMAEVMQRKDDAAIRDANKGLLLKPRSSALLSLRAAALNDKGQHAKARDDAQAAVAADPKDAFAHLQLAMAKEGLRAAPAEVLPEFQEAARLNGQFEHFYKDALQRLAPTAAPAEAQKSAQPPLTPRSELLLAAVVVASAVVAGLALWLLSRRKGMEAEQMIGSIKLGPVIGRGGMGVIHEGRDMNLGRDVAVKRIASKDPGLTARLVNEARTVASLRHANILSIFDAFEHAGTVYLIFELVRGETLEELVRKQKRLAPNVALDLLNQIASALDYAHGKGVIHRDLKPGNVMVEDGQVKLMDFGLALSVEGGKAKASARGTPAYMAPEQATGSISRASDLYSFGLCAHYLLTGKLPGGAALPPALKPVFERALAHDPAKRFPSAAELVEDLRKALGGAA